MNVPPFILVLLASAGHLYITTWDLGQERELHLDTVVDVVIVLKDDIVVEIGVRLVPHDPIPLQRLVLLLLFRVSGTAEFFTR